MSREANKHTPSLPLNAGTKEDFMIVIFLWNIISIQLLMFFKICICVCYFLCQIIS